MDLIAAHLPVAIGYGSDRPEWEVTDPAETLAGLCIAHASTTLPHSVAMTIGPRPDDRAPSGTGARVAGVHALHLPARNPAFRHTGSNSSTGPGQRDRTWPARSTTQRGRRRGCPRFMPGHGRLSCSSLVLPAVGTCGLSSGLTRPGPRGRQVRPVRCHLHRPIRHDDARVTSRAAQPSLGALADRGTGWTLRLPEERPSLADIARARRSRPPARRPRA